MEDILNEIISLEHEIENSNKDKLWRFNFGFFNENDKLKFVTPFLSIKLQDEGKLNIRYPEWKKACVVLTHDIDLPVHSLLNLIKLLFKDFKKKYYKNAYYRILWFFNKQKDLWRNFNYIMDLEEKYSAKSSFYFMSTRDTHKLYNIEKFENDIKNISNRWFEIWLHWGYDNSWKDLNILMEEKQRLEKCLWKKIIWIRQHYLRYDHNKTLVNDKKAWFLYDTTLGYNDYIWFRNGMWHIFNPIDLNTWKLIKWFYEIPLVIMDCTLWNYMKLDFNEAWQEVKSILDKVISIWWTVSILWHNDQFDDTFHPRSWELYEKILIYLKNNNVWMTSGEECLKYLKETNQI
jgi:hypothetical protein